MIQAEDGQKMSKSKGNVVTPDSVVEQYGADALRLYELFIAPFEQTVAWSDRGVQGCYRFLSRFWGLVDEVVEAQGSGVAADEAEAERGRSPAHAATRPSARSPATWRRFRFNTAVSALMELQNELLDVWTGARGRAHAGAVARDGRRHALLLAPMAPHVPTRSGSCSATATTVLDAPGRRGTRSWPPTRRHRGRAGQRQAARPARGGGGRREGRRPDAARAADNAARFLEGKQVVKEIYVPGKLVNFVVR